MGRRKSAGNTTNVTSVPEPLHIQELQNYIDFGSQKIESIRNAFLQQNRQIAKENSTLKMKLNEMESKLNQLIQENMLIRSKLSLAELSYKEKLNENLKILEDTLLKKFQDIISMFDTIRENESIELNASSSRIFQQPSSSIPSLPPSSSYDNDHSVNKKKRKSSRRQSMFIPSDFEFTTNIDHGKSNPIIHQDTIEKTPDIITTNNEGNNNNEFSPHIYDEEIPIDYNDNSLNHTNSIIDYSIPEENNIANDKQTTPVSSVPTTAKETIVNKKHAINPPRIQSKKKKIVVDEVMPLSSSSLMNSTPKRRTRGKTVDYKLPSLRAKMRRPTEKLVDATTTIDIHDLQVNYSKKNNSKSTQNISDPNNTNCITKIHPSPNLSNNENIYTIHHENSTSTNQSPSKNSSTALSDITNTNIPTKKKIAIKTRKLFKNAIINDFNDQNSAPLSSSSSASNTNNKSVSFRLSDDDLSIFDLFENTSKNNQKKGLYNRTHQNNTTLKGKKVLNL
ncbi:hypothetical protein KAFR_0D02390 [Kazachstania africana CBS 2517]|uniref:Shugoshin C-terminal domain-containing protein n=1 Tax=Kazachstania africana (strain ATCC 22294 / BCRC 22015 / CBS 2517 / CECT 1963 / NBRC 1671 / NRRL Y-8276) TaxID=1071382 RepID=H2AU36_KAZAF|nr:hypothetical protein KAFR_0D02390 [Kazachstania africana CBS 2517]CCF57886.1 hypothetical protein KAFR_0D02390 [Kazachstania africana CBS 2517]